MTKKTWLIFAALCIILVGGVVWLSRGSQINLEGIDIHTIQTGSEQSGGIGDHVLGKPDAKVRIIEYGDYQCPGCKQVAPVLKAVQQKYSDHVSLVFRNFPLVTIHPNARAAAASAEAVALQDPAKYWDMYTLLYQNQDSWSSQNGQTRTDMFASYATSLGLDHDRFLGDVTSKEVAQKIDFDTAMGRKVGVESTPSIYVNGKLADQNVENGEIAKSGGSPVWNSQATFEKFVIIPALKEAGVSLETATGTKSE